MAARTKAARKTSKKAAPKTIDLGEKYKAEYSAPKKPALIDVREDTYLAIDGQGAPGGEAFTSAIGALYGIAYTVKMTRKFAGRPDYTIARLETVYWSDAGCVDAAPRDQWRWTHLIRTPGFVKPKELADALAALKKRGKEGLSAQVTLRPLAAGRCVQMLHVGPYDRVGQTMALMNEFVRSQGLEFHGRHHEIYISDPRRVAPEKLKTILRQPVRKA
jgi:hypothetical protein